MLIKRNLFILRNKLIHFFHVNHLTNYADDIAILAASEIELRQQVSKITELAATYGHRVLPEKCKQLSTCNKEKPSMEHQLHWLKSYLTSIENSLPWRPDGGCGSMLP